MAGTVWLSEYTLTTIRGVQMLQAPPLRVQAPILATSSAQTFLPFLGSTESVRLHVDSGGPVCVQWGSAPSATTNDERWAPNQTEARGVRPGDTVSIIVSLT